MTNEALPFPDADFPIVPDFRTEYWERVVCGRQRMSESTVVICGLARDVEKFLPRTIARIERLAAMFKDYSVVIYENDSQDQTKALLGEWADRNPRVHVTLEQRGDPINPIARCLKRAERMARYRNACRETVRTRFGEFSHVIVIDTDLEYGWSDNGVANTFGHDQWDFVGANGLILRRSGFSLNKLVQYDAWAFRLDEQFTPLTTREVNDKTWQPGEPLVPVTSCFGGLGVYRMPAYLAGAYAGHDIEHVTHQQVARACGFKNVFLNPSQITLYGRHRRRCDMWMIPLITATSTVLKAARFVDPRQNASAPWEVGSQANRVEEDSDVAVTHEDSAPKTHKVVATPVL